MLLGGGQRQRHQLLLDLILVQAVEGQTGSSVDNARVVSVLDFCVQLLGCKLGQLTLAASGALEKAKVGDVTDFTLVLVLVELQICEVLLNGVPDHDFVIQNFLELHRIVYKGGAGLRLAQFWGSWERV